MHHQDRRPKIPAVLGARGSVVVRYDSDHSILRLDTSSEVRFMSDEDGYICGFHIKTDGTTEVASMEEIGAASANDEWSWLHFDVSGSRTNDWLKSKLGLNDVLIEALTSEGSRPRTTVMTSGTLIILRGVNLHPESDPTD